MSFEHVDYDCEYVSSQLQLRQMLIQKLRLAYLFINFVDMC